MILRPLGPTPVVITGGFIFGQVASMACSLGKNGKSASICSNWTSINTQLKKDLGKLMAKVYSELWSVGLGTRSRYVEIHTFNGII